MPKSDLDRAIILTALVLLSLTIVIPNHVLTIANDRVGLALEWQEVQGIAQAAGVSTADLVESLKAEGAEYMVVREDTVGRLKERGQLQLLTGWELRQLAQMLESEPAAETDILGEDTYILTEHQQLYRRLEERLAERYPGLVRGLDWKGEKTKVLALPKAKEQLIAVGIGISPAAIEAVTDLGLKPVPAWLDGAKSETELKLDLALAAQVKAEILIPGPLPAGAQEKVGAALAELDILQGVLEFDPAPGAAEVAAAADYKTLRVYERPVHTIYQEYLLAGRDRNVRMLVPHLLWQVPLQEEGQSLLGANRDHLRQVVAAVESAGLKLGAPEPFVPKPAPRGTVAAMVALTLALAVNWQRQPRLPWGLACAGMGLGVWLGRPALALGLRKGAALALAAGLPAVTIFWALGQTDAQPDRPLKAGSIALLMASGLTLGGGIVVQGLLGDIEFLLKLDEFTGIKVAYSITFFLVLARAYRERWQGRQWWRKKQIAPRELLVLGLLVLTVWVLFNRSGNTSVIPIPAWELKARRWLETMFFVRPRTKEFLVGHPALMLAAAGWARDRFYRPQLLVLAAAGQASLMNTFVHLHTPIVISLLRSVLGLMGGVAVGAGLLGMGKVRARRGKQDA